MITVSNLIKTFRAPVRGEGLRPTLAAVLRRRYRDIDAVGGVSFEVESGSLVGFIGPNGAGKTTTMKMLSGILHPSSGDVSVLGHAPHRREPGFLRRIVLLRGSQPISGPADLTVGDHFRYRTLLYEVPASTARARVRELEDVLGLGELMDRQVRALSLGQRMRAALGLSLVHYPDVVFLDEPTIGLDASAALAFRGHIRDFARLTGATVMLTSHHLAEIESLCPRVLLIDQGRIQHDGSLADFAATVASWKEIRLTLADSSDRRLVARLGEITGDQNGQIALRVARDDTAAVMARLLSEVRPVDLSVVDPSLDVVMDLWYRRTRGAA